MRRTVTITLFGSVATDTFIDGINSLGYFWRTSILQLGSEKMQLVPRSTRTPWHHCQHVLTALEVCVGTSACLKAESNLFLSIGLVTHTFLIKIWIEWSNQAIRNLIQISTGLTSADIWVSPVCFIMRSLCFKERRASVVSPVVHYESIRVAAAFWQQQQFCWRISHVLWSQCSKDMLALVLSLTLFHIGLKWKV